MSSHSLLRSVRNRLFGGWDRTLATLSISSSIISTFTTIILITHPSEIPKYIVFRDLTIVFALITALFVLLIRYFWRDAAYQHQIDRLSSQFRNAHILIHNFRSTLSRSYFPYIKRLPMSEDERRLFHRVCSSVVEGARSSLIEYFKSKGIDIGEGGEDVHIAVKLVVSTESILQRLPQLSDEKRLDLQTQQFWLITAYRDNHTYDKHKSREIRDKLFNISENTAYHHIIHMRSQYFLENNLRTMMSNYKNQNTNWRSQYDSVLAVPIRYLAGDSLRSKEYICYGILSADSLNESGRDLYNAEECLHILGQAADLLATFFLLLALTKHQPSHQGTRMPLA